MLAATTLLLDALGQGFNIMTLGSMAAAVGLIIDDSIGMVEHLVRRLRERAELLPVGVRGAPSRLLAAVAEFTLALTASSLSTVFIFAPLAFLSGVTGAFFKALSLTMAIALAISYLVTLLAVPVLADLLLGPEDAAQSDHARWTARLRAADGLIVRLALAGDARLAAALRRRLRRLPARQDRLHAQDGRGRLQHRRPHHAGYLARRDCPCCCPDPSEPRFRL